MKVVIDTNVFVSGGKLTGPLFQRCLTLAGEGRATGA